MIHFSDKQWAYVSSRYDGWWNKTNKTPIIGAVVREHPITESFFLINQSSCNDFSVTPKEIVDGIELWLSQFEYYGDAYPCFCMDVFGPGIVAALLGAELNNKTGSVWFMPPNEMEICDLHFELDENNIWLNRIVDIYTEAERRFSGQALLSMADLGGSMDILSSFRPGELLLYDLYDYPEQVERAVKEIDVAWQKVFDILSSAMNCKKYGYTDWTGIFSKTSSYAVQSDFSYMIGEDMFEAFVYDSLKYACNSLDHSIYHLDGPGEIKHLDKILTLDRLNAVQWIPGAGNPDCNFYPELYAKIIKAGKSIQLMGQGFDVMSEVIRQTNSPGAIQHSTMYVEAQEKEDVLRRLNEYK